jgi:NADPH2:quinone reductase
VYEVPDGLPLDRAVAVFQAGAVAAGVLTAMRVRAGDTVLVTAAAGRLGSLLVQLAKAAGARVIGAAGGEEKAAAASAFGADVAVDYRRPGWVAEVRAATGGRGASVVLDAIGGTTGGQAVEAAADGTGRVGLYGLASGSWTTVGTPELSRRGLTLTGALGVALARPEAEQRAHTEQALNAAASGRLVPRIHAAHPLEHAARAHGDLEGRRTIGAVVLIP